jgi:hypothetical protein
MGLRGTMAMLFRCLLSSPKTEDTMTSHLRHGAVMLMLLGSLGVAAAQTTSTSSLSPKAAPTVKDISPEQRTVIYATVTKEKRPPLKTDGTVAVGSELPASVELYTLPDSLLTTIPATKEYKYAMWNSQVVLVDPTSMKVVELIRQ